MRRRRPQTLFFVDSVGSYDERIISITKAAARLLHHLGIDFGILGEEEKDAGNEVKRFGEEMLFQELKAHNTEADFGGQASRDRHRRSPYLQCVEKGLQRPAAGAPHHRGAAGSAARRTVALCCGRGSSAAGLHLPRSLLSGTP